MTVGHTHCDVDQMFSNFSPFLRDSNVWTLEDLVRICRASFTPAPEFHKLERVRKCMFLFFFHVQVLCMYWVVNLFLVFLCMHVQVLDYRMLMVNHIQKQWDGTSVPHCFKLERRSRLQFMIPETTTVERVFKKNGRLIKEVVTTTVLPLSSDLPVVGDASLDNVHDDPVVLQFKEFMSTESKFNTSAWQPRRGLLVLTSLPALKTLAWFLVYQLTCRRSVIPLVNLECTWANPTFAFGKRFVI